MNSLGSELSGVLCYTTHMVTTILSDFSKVILFAKNKEYKGKLNDLNKKLSEENPDYSFFDYFEFNGEILELYKSLKNDFSLNIFTTGTIQERPEVKKIIDPLFEAVYSATKYGLNKKQIDSYLFIAKKLEKAPSEILYIDDKEDNLIAAQQAGMNTIHFLNYKDLHINLQKILKITLT